MFKKLLTLFTSLLMASFLLTACQPATTPTAAPEEPAEASPTETPAEAEKVTITWWHITTKDPGLSDWQKMADDYMAAHPNVTIEITVLENEAFKTKLTTVMQSGDPPDIFQSWGGGTFNQQVEAGLLKDITADLNADAAWHDSYAPGALGVYS
jgi:raffinose/stachyose/melibiose transport system substrate-binding protein